jgi:hypothetical protein
VVELVTSASRIFLSQYFIPSGAFPQIVCSTDYGGVTFGANDTTFGGYGDTNTTYIVLLASKNNATNATAISGLAGSGFMYFNLTYQVA